MDTWTRLPIPYVRGWNNGPDPLSFMVAYDDDTDLLTITSNYPVFGTLTTINYQTDEGSGTINLPDFTINSPTSVTIPGFGALVGDGAFTLEQLDFFDLAVALIGVWAGSVVISTGCAGTPPVISTVTSPGDGRVRLTGTGFVTATQGPVVVMALSIDTIPDQLYYDPAGPDSGLNPVGSVITWTDTIIEIENLSAAGFKIISAAVADSLTEPCYVVAENTGSEACLVVSGSGITVSSQSRLDTNTVRIEGAGFDDSSAWGEIDFVYFRYAESVPSPPIFANPNGPNPGDTDPSVTINEYTDVALEFENTADTTLNITAIVFVRAGDGEETCAPLSIGPF